MTLVAGSARLLVTALPARAAYDFEHFRDQLADPSVLDYSVAIRVCRAPLLAVAVGGPRRGGCFPASDMTVALAVRALLEGRHGYPDLRLVRPPSPDTCFCIEWGEIPPDWRDDVVRGRFYGYSEAAIAKYLRPIETRDVFAPG